MIHASITVHTLAELLDALDDKNCHEIRVSGIITHVPTFTLRPGLVLSGESEDAALHFKGDNDGLQLTRDNLLTQIFLNASPHRRAIFNDLKQSTLGVLQLANVSAQGQVVILADGDVRAGHVEIDGLDIIAADARGDEARAQLKPGTRPKGKAAKPGPKGNQGQDRPAGFGVHVTQGAFTLWNMQKDASVILTAKLQGVSAGRPSAPVYGSGIFVSGTLNGGRISVPLLETGAVYSDGLIPPGTPDQITGGVFTVYNAHVDTVRNLAPVTTYGVNDMVLDNWGSVDTWEAQEKITSFGASGIGFVNFGNIHELRVLAPIETFGTGARGFNVYDGTLNHAEFDRITTHGDGSVGIQVSKPLGSLVVHRGVETFGGAGDSLVKGVMVHLLAVGLSIKPGGSVGEITVSGGIKTHGEGVVPLEVFGTVQRLSIDDGLEALTPEAPKR